MRTSFHAPEHPCRDKKPLVRWGKFHDIAPVDDRHLGTALSSPGRPSEPGACCCRYNGGLCWGLARAAALW